MDLCRSSQEQERKKRASVHSQHFKICIFRSHGYWWTTGSCTSFIHLSFSTQQQGWSVPWRERSGADNTSSHLYDLCSVQVSLPKMGSRDPSPQCLLWMSLRGISDSLDGWHALPLQECFSHISKLLHANSNSRNFLFNENFTPEGS